jgi:hypothetical protein
MKMTQERLEALVAREPNRRVVVTFKDGGKLETTLAYAVNPNASMRYFNPEAPGVDRPGDKAIGWKQPWYYAEEVATVKDASEIASNGPAIVAAAEARARRKAAP